MDLSGELDFAPDLRIELFPLVSDLTAVRHLIQTLSPARVHLAGGKLFADGTLNARTALTINPYADPLPNSPCGVAMVTPRELDDAIRACDALGLPLAVHAIGDGAVRMVLDAHQRVRPRALGQRIEHAELIDPADVPRFAQLAITASLQPCHLLTDVPALTTLLPHALDRVMPIKALIDSGLTPGALVRGVIFGSDAPIVRADPGDSIAGATRGAASNPGAPLVPGLETLSPDQAIDERTAWSCFQVNATPQPTLSP
jgi:predicted amidohydrolase YtcJ